MKIIFLSFLIVAAFAKPRSLPSFSLIEERSKNGNPLVEVTFADGSSDYLVLNRYRGMDGHFIGHLKNEPDACVAMVNHPKHVELTIFSKRTVGSPMYKWNGNREVELIPLPFSNGERDGELGDEDELIDQENENELMKIEASMTEEEVASVPTTAKLQLKIGYDDSILEHLGTADAVEAYWNAALPHLQAHFCHSTLGTKINIETLDFKHYEGKRLTATIPNLNDMMGPTAEDIGTADLMVYMCNDTAEYYGVIGYAPLGVVCSDWTGGKLSICEWRTTASSYGFLVAHEMGHNLGMSHTWAEPHKSNGCETKVDGQYVIVRSDDISGGPWSSCSKADFEAHYLQVKDNWCMEEDDGDFCDGLEDDPNCTGGCGYENYKGDGWCDDENNYCGCEWDGGDCCGDNVKTNYCSACECLEPQ